MHTLLVILAGLLLLGACALLGHAWSGVPGIGFAVRLFVSARVVLAGVNAGVGVARAGYPLVDELPILALVAAVPIGTALATARALV